MPIERLLVAAALTLAAPAANAAQPDYPDKPIRLVIGSAPGSGPDIVEIGRAHV